MNPTKRITSESHSVVEIGPIEQWKEYTAAVHSLPGVKVPGKLFLHQILGLTGMEVSANCLPAGVALPFYHTHQRHEELYLFIKGQGQFQVDGSVVDIDAGTVLRVAPSAERTWRNNSAEDLYYIVVQAPHDGLDAPGTEDGLKVNRTVRWPS